MKAPRHVRIGRLARKLTALSREPASVDKAKRFLANAVRFERVLHHKSPFIFSSNAQRIAIAEACGWRKQIYTSQILEIEKVKWVAPDDVHAGTFLPPDYLSDLNAMNEAEKVLDAGQCFEFQEQLRHVQRRLLETHQLEDKPSCFFRWSATAAQRAEAFLKTIGKWAETEQGSEVHAQQTNPA